MRAFGQQIEYIFRTDDWDDVEPKMDLKAAKEVDERRALGVEIRELNAKRALLDRKSPEYLGLSKKSKERMEKFRATAPKQ